MKNIKMQSSPSLRNPLGRLVSAVLGVMLLGAVLPVFAQQPYESPAVLSASKILPP